MNKTNKIKSNITKSIAIIGCGPSGIAAYIEIIRRYHCHLKNIFVFDKKGPMQGDGFVSSEDTSLANTSVAVSSLEVENELGLFKWLHEKYPEKQYTPASFVPRKLIREYGIDQFEKSLTYAKFYGCITVIIKSNVIAIKAYGPAGKSIVENEFGEEYIVDAVVIATGTNMANSYPEISNSPNYIPSPYPESNFLDRIQPESKVLVIGSKLSAIDIVLAISVHAPSANTKMVSRSGLLPGVRNEFMLRPLTNFFYHSELLSESKINQCLDAWISIIKNCESIPLVQGKNKAYQQLISDMKLCRSGKISWQEYIPTLIDAMNEVYPKLKADQRQYLNKINYGSAARYIASFPVQNAEKIVKLIETNKIEIISIGSSKFIEEKSGKFHGMGVLNNLEFDIVINATGIEKNHLDTRILDSLKQCGVKLNMQGGIIIDKKLDHIKNTTRIKTNNPLQKIYAMGPALTGEIMLINYVRASVMQAKWIADDLMKEIIHNNDDENIANEFAAVV